MNRTVGPVRVITRTRTLRWRSVRFRSGPDRGSEPNLPITKLHSQGSANREQNLVQKNEYCYILRFKTTPYFTLFFSLCILLSSFIELRVGPNKSYWAT